MAPNNNLRLLTTPPSVDVHNGILVYTQDEGIPDDTKLTVRVGERTRTARFEGGQAWLRFNEPFSPAPLIQPLRLVKPDRKPAPATPVTPDTNGEPS